MWLSKSYQHQFIEINPALFDRRGVITTHSTEQQHHSHRHQRYDTLHGCDLGLQPHSSHSRVNSAMEEKTMKRLSTVRCGLVSPRDSPITVRLDDARAMRRKTHRCVISVCMRMRVLPRCRTVAAVPALELTREAMLRAEERRRRTRHEAEERRRRIRNDNSWKPFQLRGCRSVRAFGWEFRSDAFEAMCVTHLIVGDVATRPASSVAL